jgi:hypothetical protein
MPGVVTAIAAWMLDPVTCAGMATIGAPRVTVSALLELHHLLIERGFRRSSRDGTRSLQCSDDDGPKADLAREHNMHGNRRVALAGELELLNPPRCRAG